VIETDAKVKLVANLKEKFDGAHAPIYGN